MEVPIAKETPKVEKPKVEPPKVEDIPEVAETVKAPEVQQAQEITET